MDIYRSQILHSRLLSSGTEHAMASITEQYSLHQDNNKTHSLWDMMCDRKEAITKRTLHMRIQDQRPSRHYVIDRTRGRTCCFCAASCDHRRWSHLFDSFGTRHTTSASCSLLSPAARASCKLSSEADEDDMPSTVATGQRSSQTRERTLPREETYTNTI